MRAVAYLMVLCAALVGLAGSVEAQDQDADANSGRYAYLEVGGKGYVSANIDVGIAERTRLTLGLTMLDYEYGEQDSDGEWNGATLPSPGGMLIRLSGRGPKFFELGAGMSISPAPWKGFSENDSALSFHGVIGYRYQKPGKMFFRVGFTPFYRVNWMALPLIGLSFGYGF